MAIRVYAKRYSQAVFEIARETKEVDRWQSDLNKIARVVGDATVAAFLESPKVPFDDKTRLLSEQLGDINHLALNLVYLLVARGRLRIIGDIADDYQRLLDNYRGIEPAEVITAIPLDEEGKQKLVEHLSTIIGKKVTIKAEVDSSVIGGVIARIGGKLLDGSTHSKLEALKKQLVGPRR